MATDRYVSYPMKIDDRPKVVYEYYVTGRGRFPYDMLRYDSCWPADGESAASMAVDFGDPDYREYRSIKLRSYREPTIARWDSFIWSVGRVKL